MPTWQEFGETEIRKGFSRKSQGVHADPAPVMYNWLYLNSLGGRGQGALPLTAPGAIPFHLPGWRRSFCSSAHFPSSSSASQFIWNLPAGHLGLACRDWAGCWSTHTFSVRQKKGGDAHSSPGTWEGGTGGRSPLFVAGNHNENIYTALTHRAGNCWRQFTWVINPGDPYNSSMRKY